MTLSPQNAAEAPLPQKRKAKLSPELNEFLHMLDSLEGQLTGESRRAS